MAPKVKTDVDAVCVAAEKEKDGLDMDELEADSAGLRPLARNVSLLMGGINLILRGGGERGSWAREGKGKRVCDRQG